MYLNWDDIKNDDDDKFNNISTVLCIDFIV